MQLSDYAKQMGVRYETVWRWFRDGKIQGQHRAKHKTEAVFRALEAGESEDEHATG
jgi:predicted site-specific integrase-resolvase